MYTGKTSRRTRPLLAIGAVVFAIFAGDLAAKDSEVTVTLHVSAAGLDLTEPADAQKFYTRLKAAARVVCTHGNRVDLVPSDDPQGCYEKSLAEAVRAVKAPLITQIYLASHLVRGAPTGWTYVPVPAAPK
jgi:UrcA family protein